MPPGTRTAQHRRVTRAPSEATRRGLLRRLALRSSSRRHTSGFAGIVLSFVATRSALSSPCAPKPTRVDLLTRARLRSTPAATRTGALRGTAEAGLAGAAAQGRRAACLVVRAVAFLLAPRSLRHRSLRSCLRGTGAVAALLGNPHSEAPALARARTGKLLCVCSALSFRCSMARSAGAAQPRAWQPRVDAAHRTRRVLLLLQLAHRRQPVGASASAGFPHLVTAVSSVRHPVAPLSALSAQPLYCPAPYPWPISVSERPGLRVKGIAKLGGVACARLPLCKRRSSAVATHSLCLSFSQQLSETALRAGTHRTLSRLGQDKRALQTVFFCL